MDNNKLPNGRVPTTTIPDSQIRVALQKIDENVNALQQRYLEVVQRLNKLESNNGNE